MPSEDETQKLIEETRKRRRKAFKNVHARITKTREDKADGKQDEPQTDE